MREANLLRHPFSQDAASLSHPRLCLLRVLAALCVKLKRLCTICDAGVIQRGFRQRFLPPTTLHSVCIEPLLPTGMRATSRAGCLLSPGTYLLTCILPHTHHSPIAGIVQPHNDRHYKLRLDYRNLTDRILFEHDLLKGLCRLVVQIIIFMLLVIAANRTSNSAEKPGLYRCGLRLCLHARLAFVTDQQPAAPLASSRKETHVAGKSSGEASNMNFLSGL